MWGQLKIAPTQTSGSPTVILWLLFCFKALMAICTATVASFLKSFLRLSKDFRMGLTNPKAVVCLLGLAAQ